MGKRGIENRVKRGYSELTWKGGLQCGGKGKTFNVIRIYLIINQS